MAPSIVRLTAENAELDNLPPTYYLTFSLQEFPGFLANPTGTLADLGYPAENLTVVVKDHIWDSRERAWVTENPDRFFADNGGLAAMDDGVSLPPAQHWVWWCGYQDEMCVCERVLGG